MPIHEHICNKGTVTEDIYSEAPASIDCPCCAAPATLMVSNIARTRGSWGATGLGGTEVNPYYDRGLGASYTSWAERDRIMKAKGLRDHCDAEEERALSKQRTHIAKEEAYCATYEKHVQAGAEPIQAMQLAQDVKAATN